jgi:hypothetical protein
MTLRSASLVPDHALRAVLQRSILFCLLTASIVSPGCRPGGVRVRTWEEAVALAQEELSTAGDIEGRLEGYAGIAADLGDRIDAIERARPALDLVQTLRGVQVPLLGDGWDILLGLISVATIDGARILGKLEETLTGLLRLKDSLGQLSVLPDTAQALRGFRARPERATLAALSDAAAGATPAMRQVQGDIGNVSKPLDEVTTNFDRLLSGLRWAAAAEIPVVSDAARRAVDGLTPIQEPLQSLNNRLAQLELELGEDAGRLERIQEAVRQVRAGQE